VFDAILLDRDYSTVDTKEPGIRLGNQSPAAKIIKRGILSQVVIGVDANSARKIQDLPGALRVLRHAGKGELARWNPGTGLWEPVAHFDVPDQKTGCSIIELKGIVLGNVKTPEALSDRLRVLLQSELREMKVYRLSSKVLSILSTITLFYSVRSGVESDAIEPFALIFAIAVGLRA